MPDNPHPDARCICGVTKPCVSWVACSRLCAEIHGLVFVSANVKRAPWPVTKVVRTGQERELAEAVGQQGKRGNQQVP